MVESTQSQPLAASADFRVGDASIPQDLKFSQLTLAVTRGAARCGPKSVLPSRFSSDLKGELVAQATELAQLKALASRFDEAAGRYSDFCPSLTIPVRLDAVPESPEECQLTPIGRPRVEFPARDAEAAKEFHYLARLALKHLSPAGPATTTTPIADWLMVVYEAVGAQSCLEAVERPDLADDILEPEQTDEECAEPERTTQETSQVEPVAQESSESEPTVEKPSELEKTDEEPPNTLTVGGWQERITGGANAFRLSASAIALIAAPSKEGAAPSIARAPSSTKGNELHRAMTKSQRRAKWVAEAMLLVRDHPDWSDTEIAGRVERDKSQLSRSPEYQLAAAQARGPKKNVPSGYVTVDAKTGLQDVEAVTAKDYKSGRGQQIPGSKYYREYCSKCGEDIRVLLDEVGTKPVCDDCRK
jgi:hypothetical protein